MADNVDETPLGANDHRIKPPTRSSIGRMTNQELIEAVPAATDGILGIKTAKAGMRMDGRQDPVYGKSGLSIGDRVYHKKQKCEGHVVDIMASGPVHIKLENGKEGKTNPENLVKL